MKTKNTRLHYDDLKSGMTIYVAHPKYGIEVIKVSDPKLFYPLDARFSPRNHEHAFFKSTGGGFSSSESVNDNGLNYGESYNYRRSFRKLKHAEEWANKMKTDPGFLKYQSEHERSIVPIVPIVFDDIDYGMKDDFLFADDENYGLNAE